jgi:aldehyde dehydrogenase (NAD+)
MSLNDGAFAMTIDGAAVFGDTTFDVINPATEKLVAAAPDCSRAQLDRAFAAARRAFPAWSSTPVEQRKAAIAAIADRILENEDRLMRILTSEQGKSHADAKGEIQRAAAGFKAVTTLDLPVLVTEDTDERRIETRRVPLGVVAAIAPWNFPVLLGMMKVAPALLAGNTLVLKPSPFTPLTTLRIGQLVADLLPPGVFNVVSGGDQLGPWMSSHPEADKVTFTGSTATGRRVMEGAAPTLKHLTLELGGNDATIVMPDVDVDAIAEKIFWSAFRNAGQICIAAKRLYVHRDVYEPLRDALVAYARTVKVGDGADQGTQIGPLNNKAQYDRVVGLMADAKEQGYRFAVGGEPTEGTGYFLPVTIIDNPPENSRIVQEEQFGPILPLLIFEDIDDVVARANDTEYGLGSSVWSGDYQKAEDIGRRLESGMVWINDAPTISFLAPFSGHKQSGLGAEHGVEGLLGFTAAQTMIVRKA